MKTLLPFFFFGFSISAFGQVNYVIPPEAYTFYNNAMQNIKPTLKSIIQTKAQHLKSRYINMDSLFTQFQKEPALKNSSREKVQAVTILTLVQVSKNADADLKNLVMNMQRNKAAQKPDEVSENQVATILANKSQIAESISIALKKMPTSQEIVLENLR